MKITVKNKEFDSGKLTRNKYKKYSNARESLIDKETYTDKDLDVMVLAIVNLFDNQFTEEDINNEFDVSDIIISFMSVEFEIAEKIDNKIKKINPLFLKQEK